MDRLPALYIIFTLLNALRRGIPRANLWREFLRQKIALRPRLPFWIAVCKGAGLIDDYEGRLRVTRQARRWLNSSPEDQALHLIEAWQNVPKNPKDRQLRKKLLWKLQYDQPLTKKDLQFVHGLEALGLVRKGELTAWGKYFIKGVGALSTPKPLVPWSVQEDCLIASLPQHADLLWELENHLRPTSPGVYPLTKRALQFLPGDPHNLIALLERGLQGELPQPVRARILGQSSVQVRQGLVIEFSHAEDLKQLRRQPNLRKHVEQFLSPRHILVSAEESAGLLKMFERRGLFAAFREEPQETPKKRTHFQAKIPIQPVGKFVPKMDVLNKYLQLQQALDILYRTPAYPPEQRRITPLSIEPRGEYTYVIAYCHSRRGQRTFRLDRMEIPGTV